MLSRRLAAALSGCVFALAACSTNPYTGEREASNTGKGAAIGAAAGAAIGALTHTSDGGQAAKNALIGAGVGALAGGGVGLYMDQQEKKLRQQLKGSGVGVRRVGDSIVLVMPGNITFATDSSDINGNFYGTLNSVALVLKEYNKTVVNVTGHTDSTGSDEYNQGLSQRRANSVATYLIAQGLMPERFVVQGLGKTQPIASNDDAAGRQANRRVEIKLSPLTTS